MKAPKTREERFLPATAAEGELIREITSGNLYKRVGDGWEFVPESPASVRRAEEAAVGKIEPEPVPAPTDDPKTAAITPPAAESSGEGPSEQSREAAADAVIDAVTKRARGENDAPQKGMPLSEDDIEVLTKKRRKEARQKLEADEKGDAK